MEYLLAAAVFGFLLWRGRRRIHRSERFGFTLSDELQVTVHLAFHLAKVHGHRQVGLLHLAAAALQSEEALAPLIELGFDLSGAEGELETTLASTAPVRVMKAANLSLPAERALRQLPPRREPPDGQDDGRDPEAGPEEGADNRRLLATLLVSQDGEAREAFKRAGTAVDELVFAIAHGQRRSAYLETQTARARELATRQGQSCELWLHDDDYTPMALVVALLRGMLGLEVDSPERDEAVELMLRVHETGSARCGRWPLGEARERAEALMAGAQEYGYPLRVSLEPAGHSSS